jgi:hypothetical protein
MTVTIRNTTGDEYLIRRREQALFIFDNEWSIWNYVGWGGQRLQCVFCPCMRPVLDNTYYKGTGLTSCELHPQVPEEVLITYKMIVGT